MFRYKRDPREFGLPPRAAGGGEDYVSGIPRRLLNESNYEVTVRCSRTVPASRSAVLPSPSLVIR